MADAIDNIIKDLSKEFEGFINPLDEVENVQCIPFGLKSLDAITGRGGVPMGKITEIYGAESSGKTSLTLRLIAQAQKMGIKCGFIDTELAITKDLASNNGVDASKLIIARPDTGEEAFEILESFAEKGLGLVIVDSVSGLVPSDELEADYSQQSIGLQARLMSKGMRKIIGCIKKNKTAVVFINQIRDDINKFGYGEKTTTSGGRALRFYSFLRMKIARVKWIDKGDDTIGMTIAVKIKKNKMFKPELETTVNFLFETGFDSDGNTLDFYEAQGKLKKMGRTYWLDNKELGTREKAIEYIKANNI